MNLFIHNRASRSFGIRHGVRQLGLIIIRANWCTLNLCIKSWFISSVFLAQLLHAPAITPGFYDRLVRATSQDAYAQSKLSNIPVDSEFSSAGCLLLYRDRIYVPDSSISTSMFSRPLSSASKTA